MWQISSYLSYDGPRAEGEKQAGEKWLTAFWGRPVEVLQPGLILQGCRIFGVEKSFEQILKKGNGFVLFQTSDILNICNCSM